MFQSFETPDNYGVWNFHLFMFQFVSKRLETIESVDLEIFSLFQFVSVSLLYNLYVSMFQNTRYRGWNFHLLMPPTLKKWGAFGFGLSVCVCVFMFEISS